MSANSRRDENVRCQHNNRPLSAPRPPTKSSNCCVTQRAQEGAELEFSEMPFAPAVSRDVFFPIGPEYVSRAEMHCQK